MASEGQTHGMSCEWRYENHARNHIVAVKQEQIEKQRAKAAAAASAVLPDKPFFQQPKATLNVKEAVRSSAAASSASQPSLKAVKEEQQVEEDSTTKTNVGKRKINFREVEEFLDTCTVTEISDVQIIAAAKMRRALAKTNE